MNETLGFMNISKNNYIVILTVVSVVRTPPTLVASIYGMNFKWIPELQSEYRYFYGLAGHPGERVAAALVVQAAWMDLTGTIL